ncbi:hypothetical protein [Anaerotignum propionicum]|uniref:hypothetical protein n=1 Tax=Anaerotignum propionicum TaxID=28446 RepID=UPI00289B1941|nr:hypothetical protein [Anaerotignum propionicum]
MKNLFKRVTVTGMILSFVCLGCVSAFASEIKAENNDERYKEICESLSEEYGTTISYISDEDAKELGLIVNRPSPEEFEKDIRNNIKKAIEHNEEVRELTEQAKLNEQISEDSNLSGISTSASRATTQSATQKKSGWGGSHKVTLKSKINTSGSYNTYSSITSIESSAALFGYPKFYCDSDSATYDLIDARRTCAVSIDGVMIYESGYQVKVTEYLEFYASSI